MTKKMPALFAKAPPKRPLTSLTAIVEDWVWRFGAGGAEHHRRDQVVEYCARAKSLAQAIDRACASRGADGKMHNHQSRVPEAVRQQFAANLKKHRALSYVSDFDNLHDRCWYEAPDGIGPVTNYDVATRIAGYRRIVVQSLYLHAGVKSGWDALHGRRTVGTPRIPREALPREFANLPTDEIEDLLCTYRDFLKPWLAK